jgi:hypothetical protein
MKGIRMKNMAGLFFHIHKKEKKKTRKFIMAYIQDPAKVTVNCAEHNVWY